MGFSGHVVAFTESTAIGAAELIRLTAEQLGATQTIDVMRWPDSKQGRGLLKRGRGLLASLRTMLEPRSGTDIVRISVARTEPGEQHLGFNRSIVSVLDDVKPKTTLYFGLDWKDWKQLDNDIRAHVPEAVHGGFIPCSPVVRVGWHDLTESHETNEVRLLGRAWYSLSLFGWGSPNDWPEFRRRIFDVPGVSEVFRKVETFAGPLRRCVYWE